MKRSAFLTIAVAAFATLVGAWAGGGHLPHAIHQGLWAVGLVSGTLWIDRFWNDYE